MTDPSLLRQAKQIRDVFADLAGRFRAGHGKTPTVFYFDLGDVPAGKWTVKIEAETFDIVEGKHTDRADCTVSTQPALFLKIIRREYTPGAMDLLTGKVKCSDPFKLSVLWGAFDLES